MKSFFTFCFFLSAYIAAAQSASPGVVAGSGDYYTNAQGTISWTLGELSTETYSNANNHLTQGFQQPKLLITSVKNQLQSSQVTVYPNPVSDFLQIDMSGIPAGKYNFELCDMQGKLAGRTVEEITSGNTLVTLGMKNLSNGIYLLNIIDTANNLKTTYKISKSK